MRGLARSLKISQWKNVNVFNINVACLTGVWRGNEGERTFVLIERKYSDERRRSPPGFFKW